MVQCITPYSLIPIPPRNLIFISAYSSYFFSRLETAFTDSLAAVSPSTTAPGVTCSDTQARTGTHTHTHTGLRWRRCVPIRRLLITRYRLHLWTRWTATPGERHARSRVGSALASASNKQNPGQAGFVEPLSLGATAGRLGIRLESGDSLHWVKNCQSAAVSLESCSTHSSHSWACLPRPRCPRLLCYAEFILGICRLQSPPVAGAFHDRSTKP